MTVVLALLLSTVMASISILIHFEALTLLNAIVQKIHSRRGSVVVVMCGLLLAHVIEIWLYGAAYAILDHLSLMGGLVRESYTLEWFDSIYFSSMVYTTVGFGDLIPTGPLRLLAATEALVGLSLITWSASFTFIHMQRLWR